MLMTMTIMVIIMKSVITVVMLMVKITELIRIIKNNNKKSKLNSIRKPDY